MDLLLCNAILEVRINSAIGESLMLLLAVLNEVLVHEPTIVSMIVVNTNSHIHSKVLEAVLCLNGLRPGDGPLQIDVGVS